MIVMITRIKYTASLPGQRTRSKLDRLEAREWLVGRRIVM